MFWHFFDVIKHRYVLLTGLLMHVFGLTMMLFDTEYYHLFLARLVCSGIGVSAVFSLLRPSSVSTWFIKRRFTRLKSLVGSSEKSIVFLIVVERLVLLILADFTVSSKRTHDSKSMLILLLPRKSMGKPPGEPPFYSLYLPYLLTHLAVY